MVSPLDPPLRATHAEFLRARPKAADEDVHMLPRIVEHLIERFSEPGDLVFDPFVGFGTTLRSAIALGRNALGVELLPERVEAVQLDLPGAHVIEGDARELMRLVWREAPEAVPQLILTSPPYMTMNDHESDPLTAYEELTGDYSRYLDELSLVAAQCARVVAPAGTVVWNVADIEHLGVITPLISDTQRLLSEHFASVELIEITWDALPHDFVRDAIFVCHR